MNRISELETHLPASDSASVQTTKKTNINDRESYDQILNSLFTPATVKPSDDTIDVEAVSNNKILKIQEDIRTLMARTSGDGFKLRNFNFQSMEELRVWVKDLNLGLLSPWPFLDVKSLGLHARHHESIDFATAQEAREVTSFANVLPDVLGRGMDCSKSLSGLPTVKNWDACDGNNGLRFLLNDYNTDSKHIRRLHVICKNPGFGVSTVCHSICQRDF